MNKMKKDSKIFLAGHRGLVGSALLSELKKQGFDNIITKTHKDIDLSRQKDVESFFEKEKPEFIFLCAAKAGGIMANLSQRADFLYENLMIEANIINCAYKFGTKKLLFLSSTTVYPKNSPYPTTEDMLFSGDLEFTNKPYALAKLAGLLLCESYNIQYNTNFISLVPINLYGNNDKFDLKKAHVIPALIRKFHLAKLLSLGENELILKDIFINDKINLLEKDIKSYLSSFGITKDEVEIWGSGKASREFLHSEDLARAMIFAMQNINFKDLTKNKKEIQNTHLNISTNTSTNIKDLALMIKDIVGFKGNIYFNADKPDGVLRRLTDSTKLRSFGFKTEISLDKGLFMMYEWYKNRNGGGALSLCNCLFLDCFSKNYQRRVA